MSGQSPLSGHPAARGRSVCVVIPVHNPGALLERCLETIYANERAEVTVVVVDDGSTDGYVERAKQRGPGLVSHRGDGNLWWSGAMNVGIQWARTQHFDFVLSLNHDCSVAADALAAMVDQAADRRVIVGAKLLDMAKPDQLIGVGINFHRAGFSFNGAGQRDHGQFDHIRSVDIIDGHAMLMPVDCLNEVGSFDEAAFPQYWGDIDLILRARAMGWQIEACPAAKVWNETTATGLALGRHASWQEVRELLTSRRSHVNLRETVRFGRRHRQFLPMRRLLRRYEPHAKALGRHYAARVTGRGSLR